MKIGEIVRHFCRGSILACLVTGSFAALAAEPQVKAHVSATDMPLTSSISLTFEVVGAEPGEPPTLNIPDFEVEKAGQTNSYQWINGQSSSLVGYNYVLHPTKTGVLQIPPISIRIGSQFYSSQPIMVNVHPDTGGGPQVSSGAGSLPSRTVDIPSEGLKPVFLTANVDVSKAYVGEQILLKVQFLRLPDLRAASQPRYSEPDMTGFLVEPLNQQEFMTNLNGNPYQVTEVRYALFPTSEGEFAIGSAHIELALRAEPDPFDPNSFFQNFFGRTQTLKLNTRAIPVHVRALPKSKPSNFTGAVGRFKIQDHVDTTDLEVGKPFNLIVTIEGVGNVKALQEPAIPELNNFRRYETISSSKLNKDGKFLYGSKEFKILLIPQVSGQVSIPPVSFTYFNPEQHEYVTETAPSISLQVKPGKLNAGGNESPGQSAAELPQEGVRIVEKTIRFIKDGPVKPVGPAVYLRGTFILMNLIPPLFALVSLITRRRSEIRRLRAGEYRYQKAYTQAAKMLRLAKRELNNTDPAPLYTAISAAVSNYLADKFDLSASGLIWDDLDRRLTEKGISAELKKSLREILDEADMARFATSSFASADRQQRLKDTIALLKKMEEVL